MGHAVKWTAHRSRAVWNFLNNDDERAGGGSGNFFFLSLEASAHAQRWRRCTRGLIS
jgi:hypothetical protein